AEPQLGQRVAALDLVAALVQAARVGALLRDRGQQRLVGVGLQSAVSRRAVLGERVVAQQVVAGTRHQLRLVLATVADDAGQALLGGRLGERGGRPVLLGQTVIALDLVAGLPLRRGVRTRLVDALGQRLVGVPVPARERGRGLLEQGVGAGDVSPAARQA